jgi:CheY-like chemotaxis protein
LTPLDPATLLVVEDSDEDFDTVLEAMKLIESIALVERATSGDACLALVNGEFGPPLRPTLVLLDLSLPGLDGRDVLAAMKADRKLSSTPVIVLSTSANPKDLAFCYASGANAYHVKPLAYADHLRMLGVVFGYWLENVALLGR